MLQSLETDRLLHEAEVAKTLSVKVSTLRRWRWAGLGPRFIKVGFAVRYDPLDITAFIDAQRRSSTSEQSAATP